MTTTNPPGPSIGDVDLEEEKKKKEERSIDRSFRRASSGIYEARGAAVPARSREKEAQIVITAVVIQSR